MPINSASGFPVDLTARNQLSLLSVGDVALMLQVPGSWVYERTRSRTLDRLPGFRLGKYWRFRQSEVLAWLEQQRSGNRLGA
jgi:excisionase family DNA binding protein